MEVDEGSTDVSVALRAMTSAGAALESKSYTDFTLWYRRGSTPVSVSLKNVAINAPHDDGGVAEINDGWYRFDVPDAAFAAGVPAVAIGGTVSGGVLLSAPISLKTPAAEDEIGSGAIEWTIKITDSGNDPIDGVEVWVTTDTAGSNVVAGTLSTDASGEVAFMLDAGTYYVWKQKAGWNFTNPEPTTVS